MMMNSTLDNPMIPQGIFLVAKFKHKSLTHPAITYQIYKNRRNLNSSYFCKFLIIHNS